MKRASEANATPGGEKKTKFWANGLLDAMEDPELQIKEDNTVSVIKDKYPKARYHFLILPKENLSGLKAVKEEHLKLLKHMEKIGKELVADEEYKDYEFKFGYHAEASMFRLHLHVISDDMDSSCVKTKKHWNSFTTDFFIPSKDVCKSLKENGKVILPTSEKCKELLNTPLKCHKCDYIPKHMPDLKNHIKKHIVLIF